MLLPLFPQRHLLCFRLLPFRKHSVKTRHEEACRWRQTAPLPYGQWPLHTLAAVDKTWVEPSNEGVARRSYPFLQRHPFILHPWWQQATKRHSISSLDLPVTNRFKNNAPRSESRFTTTLECRQKSSCGSSGLNHYCGGAVAALPPIRKWKSDGATRHRSPSAAGSDPLSCG